MIPEIEELRNLSELKKINGGTLPRLLSAHVKTIKFLHTLEPKSNDENASRDFTTYSDEINEALSELDNYCDELDSAEEKDERDDAVEQIGSALETAVLSLDALMEVARIRS